MSLGFTWLDVLLCWRHRYSTVMFESRRDGLSRCIHCGVREDAD